MKFTAVVLAGDRGPDDAVARATGSPCKALAPAGGRPMVLRVLDALAGSAHVNGVVLCGPPRAMLEKCPELARRIERGAIAWLPPRESPAASAEAGLAAASPSAPILVTTADHALLTALIVDHFLQKAAASGCDAVAGVVEHARVLKAFPGTRRTVTRLRDGHYCGANLYALPAPAGRKLVAYWRRVEHSRKKPSRVILGAIGVRAALEYVAGMLTLERALQRLSQRLGARVGAVVLPFGDAAVDVDTPADLELVEATLARK